MPYVVTQSCCSDASCVYACPVNCIHPTPDEPDFPTAEMLDIDPAACVDCGACVSACPVEAIVPHGSLSPAQLPFLQLNAQFYEGERARPLLAPPRPSPIARADRERSRVAIVGSGPAAMYAADEVLTQEGASVDVYERLDRPYGLARFGVAPDHARTRRVSRLFDTIASQPGFRLHTGVTVGSVVRHEELLTTHHAVIYAVGASADKGLDIDGEHLAGCASATDFVGWYNGHPDRLGDAYDLSGSRAVVVGNGNVALDCARILTADPQELAGTEIAAGALAALRGSAIDEVVLLGRRGPAQSAFTVPELLGLLGVPGVEVVLDAPDGWLESARRHVQLQTDPQGSPTPEVRRKLELLAALAPAAQPRQAPRRIVLRYQSAPVRITGADRVQGIDIARTELVTDTGAVRARVTDTVETLPTALVLTSVGYRGVPVPDLPFDTSRGVVPHRNGRVVDARGTPVRGTYVAGWIKRGPNGFIGTNKSCAQDTVAALVADFNAGLI